MKVCSVCKQEKDLSEFGDDLRKNDGKKSSCKKCSTLRIKEYYSKHPELQRQRMKLYYQKNKDNLLQKQNEKYEEIKYSLRKKRLENIEVYRQKERDSKRDQYRKNPDKFRTRRKLWRIENIDKVRAWHSTPERRVHSNISRAIRSAIKNSKGGRQWETLVGYSLSDLLAHLESRFKDGMQWNNYGSWEIDHIKPRSKFDFSKPEALKECWNLNNLQPLWMPENRSKWARYGEKDQ